MRWFLIILGIIFTFGGMNEFKTTELSVSSNSTIIAILIVILIGILLIYKGYRMFPNNIFRKLEERKFLMEKEKFLQNKDKNS